MSMVTRCPGCDTVFRVTPSQLQAHQGKVRCGRCMLVFDGFKALATMPEAASPPPGPAPENVAALARQAFAGEPETPPRPSPPGPVPFEAALSESSAPEPEQERRLEQQQEQEPGFVEAPTAAAPEPEAMSSEEPRPAPESNPEPEPEPEPEPVSDSTDGVGHEEPQDGVTATEPAPAAVAAPAQPAPLSDDLLFEPVRTRRQPMAKGWAAVSAVLAFALAAQVVYFYRTELAVHYPGLKPLLTQACAALGCTVPLPQRPRLINIEASDLQIVDPARPSVIQLTATLRNHAGHDLAYPALDLVLTDSREHALARRIFMPGEYLPRGKDAKAGIPASAEITVKLDLETGDLGASGFRLDLLPAV
ncbi:MAG: zinc-ribbon and DUF3426 domain-containing protein, partial [Burkholderiales bacterium]|nr:zinc-ribbon and DUF3426 domain-containing protein [Burkholderiales bacterium]